MRIAKWIAILGLVTLAMIFFNAGAAAQNGDPLYFPETRRSIQGEFLRFWQSTSEPLFLFGYPITDEFYDRTTGRLTQYFQRARLELVSNGQVMEVQVANLGWMLHDGAGASANIPETGPTCRFFPRSGRTVCYAFLQFYEAHEGEKYFGEPISGLEIRDRRIVQYFEKARLEWQPEQAPGRWVVLSYLGKRAYDLYLGDSGWDKHQPYIPERQNPLVLTARAFVKDALLPAQAQQTVFIILQNQDLQPLSGGRASLTIVYPDGSRVPVRIQEATGEDGILTVTFPVNPLPVQELVNLEVTVELNGARGIATSWFKTWY